MVSTLERLRYVLYNTRGRLHRSHGPSRHRHPQPRSSAVRALHQHHHLLVISIIKPTVTHGLHQREPTDHDVATCRFSISLCRAANGGQPASQPATEEGPWRSQSSSLMVPKSTSGQSMHSRIFWCADDALRWPVACTGPLHTSWPGHTERWS
jgi:hypothetical protein